MLCTSSKGFLSVLIFIGLPRSVGVQKVYLLTFYHIPKEKALKILRFLRRFYVSFGRVLRTVPRPGQGQDLKGRVPKNGSQKKISKKEPQRKDLYIPDLQIFRFTDGGKRITMS